MHSCLTAGWGRWRGSTTSVMPGYIGIDEPCAGGVFAAHVHGSRAECHAWDFVRAGVEGEIALRLGAESGPLGAPCSRENVTGAVSACMTSIAIVDDS